MNRWDKNRKRIGQSANEEIKRGLRPPGGEGGGHGKGPYSDTCPANQRLRQLLASIPVGRPGNVIWAGMQYPAKCEAWFNSKQDAV